MMIQEFISDVCNILNISVPSVSFDMSNFSTDTMMAQCKSDGSTIYIKKIDKPNPDYLFSIAHELRHIYQIKTDYEWFLSDYQTVDKLDIESYNNQFAEIDANAFAGLIMINFFHIKPLFQGLSEDTKANIYERMEQLTELFE